MKSISETYEFKRKIFDGVILILANINNKIINFIAYYYLIVASSRHRTLEYCLFYISIVFLTLIFSDEDLTDQRASFYMCVTNMEKE